MCRIPVGYAKGDLKAIEDALARKCFLLVGGLDVSRPVAQENMVLNCGHGL